MPQVSVVPNHLVELITIVLSLWTILGISLTLIPNNTPDGVGTNGCNHRIKNIGGILMPKVGGLGNNRGRKGTKGIFHGFSLVDLIIIFCQFLLKSIQCLLPGFSSRHHSIGRIIQSLFVCLGSRVIPLDVPWHPALNGSPGVRSLNNAHGNAQFLLKRLPKIIGNR